MPRSKASKEGMVLFSVKIPRETWRLMRGELAMWNWPLIVRTFIIDEVQRRKPS